MESFFSVRVEELGLCSVQKVGRPDCLFGTTDTGLIAEALNPKP